VTRQDDAECGSLVESGCNGDVATEITNDGSHMGETDAFARLVLHPGTSKQLEYAFLVLAVNAPAIVGNFDLNPVARRGAGPHVDP
jgi:hypothetical protein